MKPTKPVIGRTKEVDLAARWADRYPSHASVRVALGYESAALDLKFYVQEDQIRALETDPWLVYRDSCVEFFFSLPGEKEYYNIEVNPTGTLLCAVGTGRNGRKDLKDSHSKLISLEGPYINRKPFEIRGLSWSVKIRIPSEIFGYSSWDTLAGGLRGNLYKCGDSLNHPHYLSWAPLSSPDPDFHRPEDFRILFSI